MITSEEFMNKIRTFGLNSYEAKLWISLLSRGVSTAGELSDISNVPRSRTYDVLESLEKKGFIVTKIGKPIKYLAIEPEEVLKRVQNNLKTEAEAKSKVLENIKETEMLEELNLLYSQGIDFVSPNDLSGSLKGRDSLYRHMEFLIKNAKESVLLVTSSEGLNRKSDALSKRLRKASENGVDIKVAAPVNESNMGAVQSLDFADVRHLDSEDLDSRFMLVDGKDLVFMLTPEKTHADFDVGVWLKSDFFANALNCMFENKWNDLEKANSD